jgi:hypothetical protein
VTWEIAPGFSYSVWRSDDLQNWIADSSDTLIPPGPDLTNYVWATTNVSEPQRFFRLKQSE